ncbi:DJ-1 family glyoxalase III [Reinekea sp. G2M2-21]|uniref:DJ-1 family glyoxalase III n=1 Tax=Reinekea sp. G2M2-21 TaxID=2788942 RepID=UPI0018AC3845|nr:DJ-1 family glyoxalase III [Reinekea sp. G2M2-21]
MKTVLVPLADGCEEMEAITITDILTRAGAKVITAGLLGGPVKASRGATLVPDTLLGDLEEDSFDLIVLPGGLPGADHLASDPNLQQLIKNQDGLSKPIAAICAAPRALVAAGILNNRTITSYPQALADYEGSWTNTGNAIEMDGHIITGRGPGVALDFALFLVEQLFDIQKRDEVESALVR